LIEIENNFWLILPILVVLINPNLFLLGLLEFILIADDKAREIILAVRQVSQRLALSQLAPVRWEERVFLLPL
jgi:hypothetical protein